MVNHKRAGKGPVSQSFITVFAFPACSTRNSVVSVWSSTGVKIDCGLSQPQNCHGDCVVTDCIGCSCCITASELAVIELVMLGAFSAHLEKCILSWTCVQMHIGSDSSTECISLFCRLQWGREKLCLKPSNQDLVVPQVFFTLSLHSLFADKSWKYKLSVVADKKKKKGKIFQGDFLFHYYLLVYSLFFWRTEVYNLVCNSAELDYCFLFPPRLTDSHFQASDLEKLCAVLKECSSISELEWVLLNSYDLYLQFFGILRKWCFFLFCSVGECGRRSLMKGMALRGLISFARDIQF